MLKTFFSRSDVKSRYPDFLILGVQKAGTTTLYDMLAMLPGFSASKNKELGFFVKDIFYNRGIEWYSSQFLNNHGLRFEATPAYIYNPIVPKRIYKYNPRCKFILLLREPASRCYSAYAMYRRFNSDPKLAHSIFESFSKYANDTTRNEICKLLFAKKFPSFRVLIEEDLDRLKKKTDQLEPSFFRRGLYYNQIQNFMTYFSLDQFLILEQSELNDVYALLMKVASFLSVEINPFMLSNGFVSNPGEIQFKNDDDLEVIKELKSLYAPFNEELFQLIGKRYNWI
jgi:hypothetical protein